VIIHNNHLGPGIPDARIFYPFDLTILNLRIMIKKYSILTLSILASVFLFTSCQGPITVTTWKNPGVNTQISNVVVMPLFEKLEYMKPFEMSMVSYFNDQGLKSIGSLSFLNPNVKTPINDIKRKCDSLGADAILVFIYQGTDKTESYVPPTTYYNGWYGGYGGYWGGGYWGGYYGGYYGGYTTTGGYWTTTATVNLSAKLYVKGSQDPIWTAEINVTDPEYIDEATHSIAVNIYADWLKNNMLKFAKKGK
jgi:hypothetical protein